MARREPPASKTGPAPSRHSSLAEAMISSFTYRSDPVRVVFGAGAVAALREEADHHKISRFLVLCSKSRTEFARRLIAPIADRCVGFCDTAGQNMPRDAFER